eukprot:scaffold22232_cov51-Phaeocystis_antarctica.AAC.3
MSWVAGYPGTCRHLIRAAHEWCDWVGTEDDGCAKGPGRASRGAASPSTAPLAELVRAPSSAALPYSHRATRPVDPPSPPPPGERTLPELPHPRPHRRRRCLRRPHAVLGARAARSR